MLVAKTGKKGCSRARNRTVARARPARDDWRGGKYIASSFRLHGERDRICQQERLSNKGSSSQWTQGAPPTAAFAGDGAEEFDDGGKFEGNTIPKKTGGDPVPVKLRDLYREGETANFSNKMLGDSARATADSVAVCVWRESDARNNHELAGASCVPRTILRRFGGLSAAVMSDDGARMRTDFVEKMWAASLRQTAPHSFPVSLRAPSIRAGATRGGDTCGGIARKRGRADPIAAIGGGLRTGENHPDDPGTAKKCKGAREGPLRYDVPGLPDMKYSDFKSGRTDSSAEWAAVEQEGEMTRPENLGGAERSHQGRHQRRGLRRRRGLPSRTTISP